MLYSTPRSRPNSVTRTVLALGLFGVLFAGWLDRFIEGRRLARRLDAIGARESPSPARTYVSEWGAAGPALLLRINRLGPQLASWKSVGGCGAGSGVGIGGIKWVGRNVTGGLVAAQSQANYTRFADGHVYSVNNQLNVDLGEKWRAGVVIPYLYKLARDPAGLDRDMRGFDVSNQGLGDINALVTRRLGPINATSLTLSIGFPTGTSRAEYNPMVFLRQDFQLGAGSFSGAALIDHTIDNLWGPVVVGGVASYPGKESQVQNYRAPSGTVYAYAGYLLGPFVPAAGLSAAGYLGRDRDRGFPSERPLYLAAVNGSLEWSNDWVALLGGVSFPFSTGGAQPWTVGLGLAVAPF